MRVIIFLIRDLIRVNKSPPARLRAAHGHRDLLHFDRFLIRVFDEAHERGTLSRDDIEAALRQAFDSLLATGDLL